MINTAKRNRDLKLILITRQRELQHDVRGRIREGRSDRSGEARDAVDQSDAGIQADMELALLQMRAETLIRIDQALLRLDAGTYGSCVECEDDISERRLRALPFALRCQACQERRERERGAARDLDQRRGLTLFPTVVSSPERH